MPLLQAAPRELYMPDLSLVPAYQAAAEAVARGERSAREIARCAALDGFFLVGSIALKRWHYPVKNRRYGDLNDDEFKRSPIPEAKGRPALRVSLQADVALLGGLFGNFNDKRERNRRCRPITGQDINFGWGTDYHKTITEIVYNGEDAHVRTHARPELIDAAIDSKRPFTGWIHAVLPHPSCVRIAHDIGQYLCFVRRETIFSIPLLGNLDLPLDIIPTDYTRSDMRRINPS